jgi:hypothetical protein
VNISSVQIELIPSYRKIRIPKSILLIFFSRPSTSHFLVPLRCCLPWSPTAVVWPGRGSLVLKSTQGEGLLCETAFYSSFGIPDCFLCCFWFLASGSRLVCGGICVSFWCPGTCVLARLRLASCIVNFVFVLLLLNAAAVRLPCFGKKESFGFSFGLKEPVNGKTCSRFF